MKNKKIECHDCGEECVILDKYDDIDPDDIRYCPFCGTDNIEVSLEDI